VRHWNPGRSGSDEQRSALARHLALSSRHTARPIALPLTRRTLAFGPLYFWYVLLATLDLLTTIVILELGGREANGIADAVLQHAGPGGLLVMKYASVMLVVCICEFLAERRPRSGRFVAVVAVALSALPVAVGWAQLAVH